MNHVTLIGRLARDPEFRTTTNGKSVASFTLAVDRRSKQEGQPTADFIPCVAWGKTAEVCTNYLAKGHRCGVGGRIQVRSYDAKDGSKRYVTEVMVDNVEFLESRKRDQEQGGGMFGESVADEEIPF